MQLNYQPTALAFSPSIKEQYIATIFITCLEENNGKGQRNHYTDFFIEYFPQTRFW